MTPAPLDLAHILPADWIDRVRSYCPAGVVTPFIQKLQALVVTHGEASIALEHVQQLALLSSGLLEQENTFLRHYSTLLQKLTEVAQGDWVVTSPLEERDWTSKQIHHVGRDIYTVDAEWDVLERLIDHGWTPVEAVRVA